MSLHLEIVTPEHRAFSGAVSNVLLPGADGELGILEGHAALVTALQPGELRYEAGGKIVTMAVGSGFAEVTQQRINVLTDMALGEDQIDEAKAEAAMKRAEEQLAAMSHNDDAEEVAHLQGIIAKSLAQLNLKRRAR
ncbi:F-type H+-transporting ATPase subunit epsilon [Haloferula luteola]|uniref:ATP synthase epsilon chain n=1 Tax=Haloferula luteola TaxID=595692 RepID=A0A840V4K2_9BACT|nr:ATP synthase F1 subunit epsilon [Haloferula luteola]MBB5352912.1 F-type H+-transporting ATPase subunit epsilon [Haloferula luteola]